MIVFLGCYTDLAHPNGLKAIELDEPSGRIRGLETVAGVYYRWDDLLPTLQQPNND